MVDSSTAVQTRQPGSSGGGTDAPTPVYPLVTVAMVAHNPGAWFTEVLRSILGQDYPALDVVVIDAASDLSIAERVHDVIPEATVVPLLANQGFAKNVNTILDHPELGSYLLVCHDDVALAPDCIRRLVEETLRSNAGVVGPKLLDWDDPNRILHVGLGADKTGLVSDLAEPGEYDQEQHDAVRDVFAVPGAVTLLRTDLFRALGGFDEAITAHGEDLDLCWRAHALGARVLVNPAATARHREDLSTRIVGHDKDRISRQHRIRSMLSNYGVLHTIRVVPQAMLASLVNIVIALFQGRVSLVIDIIAAWAWNLRRLPSIRTRRRRLAEIRQVGDAEVRALQTPGFEGLAAWRRGRADRRENPDADNDTAALQAAADRRRWFQATILVWAGVAIVLLFGSRDLFLSGLPATNELVDFPDGPSPLLTEWGSTWRSTGMGAEAPSTLLHAILGFGAIALFGQMGLLRLLVTVGMIGFGAIGAYRLVAPFRSVPAQLVALVVYVSAPLPYNALQAGSWSGLVAYGAMPWIAKRLAIAAGVPPYDEEDTPFTRRLADAALVGVLVAAASLVEPLIGASLALLLVCWIVGGLVTRRVTGLARLILATVGAAAIAFALLMPASLGLVLGNLQWSTLGGTAATTSDVPLTDLLRFATGPHGATAVGWALLVLPALSLVLAFGERLAWAVRSCLLFVVSVGIAWASTRPEIDISLADQHVLLAPAALGVAMAAGMATMAFQRDLRRYRFGWRQAVPFVAGLALISSLGAGLGGALDGRWQVAEGGYTEVFEFFDTQAPAHARTFWLGHDEVLPVQGWNYDDDLTYSITQARAPSLLDRSPGNADEITQEARDIFDETLSGSSSRLGRRLALYGIRYIVVVEGDAPAPFTTMERSIDPAIANRLSEQLDLERIESRNGATIFENRAYVPTVSSFESGQLAKTGYDVSAGSFNLALPEVTSLRSFRGPVTPSDIYMATPATTNWDLRVDGESVERFRIFGWAQLFSSDRAGDASLTHENDSAMWFGAVGQLIGWIGLVTLLILGRRRRT